MGYVAVCRLAVVAILSFGERPAAIRRASSDCKSRKWTFVEDLGDRQEKAHVVTVLSHIIHSIHGDGGFIYKFCL